MTAENQALFTVGELQDVDGTYIVVYRQLIPERIREKLQNQFIVEWKFLDPLPNGLPKVSELRDAMQLEKQMRPLLEIESESLLAFTSTGNGYREWYFYCRTPQILQKLFNEISDQQNLHVQVHIGFDPEWKTYKVFTEPFRGKTHAGT